jgi:predicted site-specific integrase-resolvase
MPDISPTEELPALLPIAAAIKRFGISKTTFYRWLTDGSVSGKKIGRNTYLLTETVQAKIANLPNYTH